MSFMSKFLLGALLFALSATAQPKPTAAPEPTRTLDKAGSFTISLPETVDPEVLADSIRRLAREQNILRVKGYVAVKGKPMRLLVQAVGERVRSQFDRPWGDTPRTSQLVVIAERHHIDRAAIEATLGV